MRATLHTELDELTTNLAQMTRLAAAMMTNASTALHHSDLALAGLVTTHGDQLKAILDNTQCRCVTLLALQAPVAGDLRVVVAALRTVDHLRRMGKLARHITHIAGHQHPNPMTSGEVRPVCARMGVLASQLAEAAATAIEHRDPLSGDRLAAADDEVDALRRHLFDNLFAADWLHGVQPAVDAALIGRYYERFADHAVAIAGQVCYLATGQTPQPSTPICPHLPKPRNR